MQPGPTAGGRVDAKALRKGALRLAWDLECLTAALVDEVEALAAAIERWQAAQGTEAGPRRGRNPSVHAALPEEHGCKPLAAAAAGGPPQGEGRHSHDR